MAITVPLVALVNSVAGAIRVRQGEQRGQAPDSGTCPLTCYFSDLAVGVGFEPTVTRATTVFKTVPLGRSGNPPGGYRVPGGGGGRRWGFAGGQAVWALSYAAFASLPKYGPYIRFGRKV